MSDQIGGLQKRAADLRSSFDQTRHETNEQVKTRLGQAKADIATRQSAVKEHAGQAADRTQSQWTSMKADAAARRQAMQALLTVLDAVDARTWADDIAAGESAG